MSYYKPDKKKQRVKNFIKKAIRLLFGEQLKTTGGQWKKVHYLEKWEE